MTLTPRGWIALGVLAVILLVIGTCAYQKSRADRAEAQLSPAKASTKALDKVSTETPQIRREQQEKQLEVDQIQGSDQRLPDGYGASLERLRRNQSNQHPR